MRQVEEAAAGSEAQLEHVLAVLDAQQLLSGRSSLVLAGVCYEVVHAADAVVESTVARPLRAEVVSEAAHDLRFSGAPPRDASGSGAVPSRLWRGAGARQRSK